MSATGRGTARNPDDAYATPAWVTRTIIENLVLPGGRWLEPCAGDGAIIRAVNTLRDDVRWTAVEYREQLGLYELADQVARDDFLWWAHGALRRGERFDVAILNPPFSKAQAFLEACRELATWVVALERINFLEGDARADWLRTDMPDVYVLPNRPSFTGTGTDATGYAWLVWPPSRWRHHGRIEVLPQTPSHQRSASGRP